MKPLEILSALPQWANVQPETIVDSPAFAMQCRLGEEAVVLHRAEVEPSELEMQALSVAFGDEPHTLFLARSPRFPDLDKVWDSRADMPEAILLALVEKECGPLFQMLENVVRKQMRLVGLESLTQSSQRDLLLSVSAPLGEESVSAALVFSLTRSAAVVAALGVLRNLDLTHEAIRSQALVAEVEYAAFAMPDADLAAIAPGDAVMLPEIGTLEPRLVVGGRFVLDGNGSSSYAEDALVRIRAAEVRPVLLGEVFDAGKTPIALAAAEPGAQLRMVRNGKVVARGRLDRIGDQNAFIVEDVS